MTDEVNAPNPDAQVKGLPEGVTTKDLDPGQNGGGNPAPVVNNEPPVKQETAEEKTAREAAEATAKAEADKKAADEKAAEEAKKAEEEKNKDVKKEFAVYNDEAADSAITLLKEAGVSPEEADGFFAKAIDSGKLEDIDVQGLTAKVGKEKANLILLGIKDYHTRVTQAVKAVTDTVYKVVGGEEAFATLRTWAQEKEKTDPEFAKALNEYRTMLDGTPTTARLAAQELLKAYNDDPKTSSLTGNYISGDSAASTSGINLQYITRADYISQLKVAEEKGDATEVARLNARRKASVAKERRGN